MQTAQRKAAEAKRMKEAQEKAKNAKKAGKSVRGDSASTPETELSLRETIRRAAGSR